MRIDPDVSTTAALIGDPARALMLSALLDGQALPASELAQRAHVTAQTASAHLARLVDGGLLAVSRSGRHRYYRLANADVARALEALATIAPPARPRTPRDTVENDALRHARTCYDHLAGRLGVAVTQGLIERRWVELNGDDFALTDEGKTWLAAWGIDETALRSSRRSFARACLDWSERRPHLAGALGAAIANRLFERGWIARIPGTRAVRITNEGRRGFRDAFGIDARAT